MKKWVRTALNTTRNRRNTLAGVTDSTGKGAADFMALPWIDFYPLMIGFKERPKDRRKPPHAVFSVHSELLPQLFHQQVFKSIETLVAKSQFTQGKCRPRAKCLAFDRVMCKPHRLIGKSKNHFMVAHDSAKSKGRYFFRPQLKAFGNFLCRAGNLWLFLEVLLQDFNVCERCNAPE